MTASLKSVGGWSREPAFEAKIVWPVSRRCSSRPKIWTDQPRYTITVSACVAICAVTGAIADESSSLAAAGLGENSDRIHVGPMAGFQETIIDSRVVYLSIDGQYAFVGDLISLTEKRNLTEDRRRAERISTLMSVDSKHLISFAPPDRPASGVIFAFAALDCTFCARFHEDLGELLRHGIEVRYVLVGRDRDTSWAIIDDVLCAENRHDALAAAFIGRPLTHPDGCRSASLSVHQSLTERFELRVTPTLISDTGRVVMGYPGYEWVIANAFKEAPEDLTRYGLDDLSPPLASPGETTGGD